MRTKIIADLTSNHLGDLQILESMIHCLAECNVDLVKTQSWQANNLRHNFPDYRNAYEYYKQQELSDEAHFRIKELCAESGLEMLTTCFDLDRVDFLATLGLKAIKVASSDSTSYNMIGRLLKHFETVIISTGGTSSTEVDKTIEYCQGHNPVFMHCVSLYPCPINSVNMNRMLYLKSKGCRFGYSDHTLGTEAGKYAICLGAEYLEKHFTLNRYLPGRDQKMSSTMDEMKELANWAKSVEGMAGIESQGLTDADLIFRENYVGKWGDNS